MNVLGQYNTGSLKLCQVLAHMERGQRVNVRFHEDGCVFCQTLVSAKSALNLCNIIVARIGYHPTVVSIRAKFSDLGPVVEVCCV